MEKDISFSLFLCDECEKHNNTLTYSLPVPQGIECSICLKKAYKGFSGTACVEEDVAEVLKDFYKHEDIAERTILNKAKKELYGKVED